VALAAALAIIQLVQRLLVALVFLALAMLAVKEAEYRLPVEVVVLVLWEVTDQVLRVAAAEQDRLTQ
jgi:hypothetical protein